MAVYAPGDSPAAGGGNQGGFLSWLQGLAPETQSAIMRVMQNANPIQPAAADTLNQAPNPLSTPTPVPAALQSGGPQVPPGVGATGPPQPPMSAFNTRAPTMVGGLPTSPQGAGGTPFGAAGTMPTLPPITGATAGSVIPNGPAATTSGWPIGPGGPAIAARPPMGTPSVAPPASTTIPPTATALAPAAAQTPFVPVYRPNADVAGGALSRGGPPKMSALDLSGLFGGGRQPTAAAAAPAAPAAAAAAQPANLIPAIRGVASTNKAPSDYGPLQRNRRWKLEGGPDLYR